MMPLKGDNKEAYSEAGLGGEASANRDSMPPNPVTVTSPVVTGVTSVPDDEPFMLRHRSEEEMNEYDKGFECGQSGGQNDDTKSEAWQRGWAEAQQ
jgi:hypothetical protein